MSGKLSGKDYVFWVLSIITMFLIFEALGNFGNLSTLSSFSPVSVYERQLFEITYTAAGGVFAIFMGSLIFLSLRFREVAPKESREMDYFKVSMPLLIISGGILLVFSYPYFSPYLPLQLQFNLGIIISLSMILLLAITFVVYKEYFKD